MRVFRLDRDEQFLGRLVVSDFELEHLLPRRRSGRRKSVGELAARYATGVDRRGHYHVRSGRVVQRIRRGHDVRAGRGHIRDRVPANVEGFGLNTGIPWGWHWQTLVQ